MLAAWPRFWRDDRRGRPVRFCLLIVLPAALAATAVADTREGRSYLSTLSDLPLVDLTRIQVMSASRKPEAVADTSAAMFVITQQDIRRCGATTLADALRFVPGVLVTQYNENDWQVSMRGLNVWPPNKLLVLVDGRSIYSPLTPGVFWAEQEILMEDIERIEVIRGPGATVWGANAVNGIINIITKRAKERSGGLVSLTAGTLDRVIASARVGDHLSPDLYGVAWFKYADRDHWDDGHNVGVFDDFDHVLGGCGLEWDPAAPCEASLQARYYEAQANGIYGLSSLSPPYGWTDGSRWRMNQFHTVGKFRYKPSENRDLEVRAFYDRKSKHNTTADLKHETYDLDAQYHVRAWDRHDIVCGASLRHISDSARHKPDVSLSRFDPQDRKRRYASLFVEDDVDIIRDMFRVKIGSKFEHNEYTDWEVQPNVRFVFDPSERQTVWGAVTRSVRTPSRLDVEGIGVRGIAPSSMPPPYNSTGLPGYVETRGGDVESEELVAYELGYRCRPHSSLWIDLAAFYNDYDELRTYEDGTGGFAELDAPPRYHHLLLADNKMEGCTYGAEASATWEATADWRLTAAYAFLDSDFEPKSGGADFSAATLAEGSAPRHMASLRSQVDLSSDIQCDVMVRFVDELPAYNIDAYTTFDLRVAWSPVPDLELSLVGRNLAEEWHAELTAYEVERSVYGKLTWLF